MMENKVNMIYNDMYKVYEKGIDKLHLIYVKLKEFMIQLNQDLRKIFSIADLSKNKLNRVDEDRNTPIDKDKDKDKDNDKNIHKTKTKDMHMTTPKTKDMDKTIPKTKTEHKDMIDKINNKISIINETSTILTEISVKV